MDIERKLDQVRRRTAQRADELFGAMVDRIEDERRAEGFLPPKVASFVPATRGQAWGYAVAQLQMGFEQLAADIAVGMVAARAGS